MTGEHSETVAFVERDGLEAQYVIRGFSSAGLEMHRTSVDVEETYTWNEVARMIRSGTMRIYDMTEEEVETLAE